MLLRRVWIPTNNFYSGYNARRLLVLHSTEGALTYQALGNYFATGTNQASSHVGIDDTLNTVGEYVIDSNSAWTSGNANTVSIQAELCAPSGASANWSEANWKSHPNMLENTAQWLKEESQRWNIPLMKLTPAQAQGNGRGVCQHSDLGAWGGGHHDCGPGFPIDYVISLATEGIISIPTEEDNVNTVLMDLAINGPAAVLITPQSAIQVIFSADSYGGTVGDIRIVTNGAGVETISPSWKHSLYRDVKAGEPVSVARLSGNCPVTVTFR